MHTSDRGITAVEALVALAIAALVILFSTHAIVYFVSTGSDLVEKTQALYLAEEGLEVMRFIRDDDWDDIDALIPGDTYYLSITQTGASTVSTPEVIGQFTRSVVIEAVSRNTGNDDIVPNGSPSSAVDPDTVLVTSAVAWDNTTTTLRTYLTNLHQ